MKRVVLILTMVLSFMAARCQQSSEDALKNTEPVVSLIDVPTLKQVIDNKVDIQLIDVRTPREFKGGTIANAQNIDFRSSQFKDLFKQKVKTEQPVYIFCHSGGRSAAAAKVLQKLGYKKIYDLKGGYSSWNN